MAEESQIDKSATAQEALLASMQDLAPPKEQPMDVDPGGIAWHIIALGLGFLVAMATLLTLYLSDTRQEGRLLTAQGLGNSAREAELALTRFAGSLERAAVAVEYGTPPPGTNPPSSEYSPLLQRIMKREATLVSIVVSDRNGLIYHASLPQMVGTQFEYSEMSMNELRSDRSRRAVLVGPIRNSLGRTLVMYVHALQTPDRAIRGMIVLTFPTHSFTTLLAPLRPNHPSGSLVLLDSSLTILAHLPDKNAEAVGSSRADFSALSQFAASDQVEALLETTLAATGEASMTAAHKTSLLDMTVLVEMSENDGVTSWRLKAFGLTLLFSLVGILLTVLIIHIIRQSLAWRRQSRDMADELQVLFRAQNIADMGSWIPLPDGQIKWSDTACQILGYRPGSIGPLEMAVGSHGTDADTLTEALAAARRGSPLDVVHRAHNGSGDLWIHSKADLTFNEQGSPTGGTGIVQNITWLRSSEEKAQATARSFREILENLPVPVWWTNDEKGRKHFNHAWTALTGMRPDPFNTDEWMVAIHPEDRRTTRSLLQIAFEKDGASSIRFKLRRTDGAYISVSCSLTPFSGDENKRGMIAVCMEDRGTPQRVSPPREPSQKQDINPPSTNRT